MKKWRIDKAYEKIYLYSDDHNAYIFYCSFFAANIRKSFSEKKIIRILESQ